jgi:hypothetical protein
MYKDMTRIPNGNCGGNCGEKLNVHEHVGSTVGVIASQRDPVWVLLVAQLRPSYNAYFAHKPHRHYKCRHPHGILVPGMHITMLVH